MWKRIARSASAVTRADPKAARRPCNWLRRNRRRRLPRWTTNCRNAQSHGAAAAVTSTTSRCNSSKRRGPPNRRRPTRRRYERRREPGRLLLPVLLALRLHRELPRRRFREAHRPAVALAPQAPRAGGQAHRPGTAHPWAAEGRVLEEGFLALRPAAQGAVRLSGAFPHIHRRAAARLLLGWRSRPGAGP